ncbi:MAG: cytochrome c3 family protein, partial [Mariprofundaceae bacterium]
LVVSSKFLRLNRFQNAVPNLGLFSEANDIMCLSCHKKDVGDKGWAKSAHANPDVAGDLGTPIGSEENYTVAAAAAREFPNGLPVWQAACLNCHDTHTVQGATRLLREATDSITTPKQGGNSAIEETCYQCHSSDGTTLVGQGTVGFEVPDIKTSFTTMLRHMPIDSLDQPAGMEVHDIGTSTVLQGGKDFLEDPANLGKGDLTKRHVECTDCHHPHRVTKNRLFWSDPTFPDDEGTHNHTTAQLTLAGESWHTNIASGVLRGTSGIEPIYGAGTAFMSDPTSFILKRGDPGISADTSINAPHVTREYQVCLKCHSNYAFDIPPQLGVSPGGTTFGTNTLQDYTNIAMEFQSPLGHQGEVTASPTGAAMAFLANNHRSWHPVMEASGRTAAVTGASASNWLTPFDMGVGQQTMYCSDCHGASTLSATVVPNGGINGEPWGPHGSNDNFILKGPWSDLTSGDTLGGLPGTSNDLCFKCHDYNSYGTAVISGSPIPGGVSGFRTTVDLLSPLPTDFSDQNIHSRHLQGVQNYRCTYCHVAIPHGWKNKALLVNLNDVGAEAGVAAGTQVRNLTTARYYQTPYYNGAVLKITTFAPSGQWQPSNCGSIGAPGNGLSGTAWMTSVSEGCQNLP